MVEMLVPLEDDLLRVRFVDAGTEGEEAGLFLSF